MYTIRALIVAAALAFVCAQDITVTPSQFNVEDGAQTYVGLYIKNNLGSSITAVSFKAVSNSPSLQVSYPGAATQVSIGTINAGVTASGAFGLLGSDGSYVLSIYIKYTKVGVAKTFNLTIPANVIIPEKKREISDSASAVEQVDESVYDNIAARDTYVNIITSAVYAEAGAVTWSQVQISVGSVATTSMSFTVAPDSPSVSIGYPANGNSLGNAAANSDKYAVFQHLADCGYYNLNVTVSYKLTGTTTTRRIWKIILLSVTGDACEGGEKRGQSNRAGLEGAEASNSIPVEYAFGIAVAGVALVAVFSVVGAMIVLRKRAEATIVA